MNAEKLIGQFNRIYGQEKGRRIYMTVIPGILADFQKMLEKTVPSRNITEKYILEDGSAVLELSGKCVPGSNPVIEANLKKYSEAE